jgi:hypothetical protein
MPPVPIPEISAVFPNVLVMFIIVGIVQWLSSTGRLSKADAPGASAVAGLVLGILLGVASRHDPLQIVYDALWGICLGLAATALYALASKVGGASASSAFAARMKPPVR